MNKFDFKSTTKNPLSRVMTIYCVLFAVFFAVCMNAICFYLYEQDMMNRYHAYTTDVLNYVADNIDGDDLLHCMRTGVKSEKYLQLQDMADRLKETHHLEFLYIIKPLSDQPPDNMMDVLAARTKFEQEYEADQLTDLGKLTGEAYPAELARQYMARIDRNPEVTFFQNDSQFGHIYTAIRPVFDSQGNPIAVLCADVLLDEINLGRTRFLFASTIMGLIAGAMLVTLMSLWLKRRVADPIARIKNSAVTMAEKCHNCHDLTLFSFEDPNIHTHDELEALSISVTAMCQEMKAYAEKLVHADQQMGEMRESFVIMDQLAYSDPLTGAGNKAAYERCSAKLEKELQKGQTEFVIIMADLNYLKRINDHFGHDCGNKYLINLHELLKKHFPQGEIFRIGGDEFVILLTGAVSHQAEEMLQAAKDHMRKSGQATGLQPWEQVSCAMGLCRYNPQMHKNVLEVFRTADSAMYHDKKAMRAEREEDDI